MASTAAAVLSRQMASMAAAVLSRETGTGSESAEQVGRSEAELMLRSSEWPPMQHTLPGADAYSKLMDDGVVRLNAVISPETAAAMYNAVSKRLDNIMSQQQGEEVDRTKLRPVMCGDLRHNLLLQPDQGVVEATLREALSGPLGVLMETAVGLKAPLFDFAAMVSEKGASRQPMHADAPYQAKAPFFNVFIALQDVSIDMGPTLLLPRTHTESAYSTFVGSEKERHRLLQQVPLVAGTLKAGDVAVFDGRLLHAGTENVKGRRAILYFSFANPAADLSDLHTEPWNADGAAGKFQAGAIAPEARGSYYLRDFLPAGQRKQ
eukprot:gnl/MRDRNA2_/MRDRNA2_156774_c0_seq1.p1 gnl/MRDRNA2_/MRDRNA2_156774_c0~~gnl/MRDRNA2_/MRDRNA2_156774_c0_seq1.p1  ORF type:complete len:332 (-),score=58.33 gnl/MRDRNA2_/MRDRNA2_156774_c0_seq1:522-1484(-)